MTRRLSPRCFRADERGATSIEFGMLAMPFFLAMLMVAEVGVETMKQATLDGAVQKISEDLQTSRFTPPPTAASLRQSLCGVYAEGAACPDSLVVELAPLPAIGAPFTSPTTRVDLGAANEVLMIRAQTEFVSVAALGALRRNLYAARLVRRP
jgi:Flp pilus assembly pilin Flp